MCFSYNYLAIFVNRILRFFHSLTLYASLKDDTLAKDVLLKNVKMKINLNSFFYPKGSEYDYTPSEEGFKFTEINAVTVKFYLATYYDMKKAGLVTDKVNELLVDNLESAAYNVIENCRKALQ